MFENVYRVSTVSPTVDEKTIVSLESKIRVPLPRGYREYLTNFGRGELCDLLQVLVPREVREYSRQLRIHLADAIRKGWFQPGDFTDEDIGEAVVFAASAEGDRFVCCPRCGSDLFEIPRQSNVIELVRGGILGAVRLSVQRMK